MRYKTQSGRKAEMGQWNWSCENPGHLGFHSPNVDITTQGIGLIACDLETWIHFSFSGFTNLWLSLATLIWPALVLCVLKGQVSWKMRCSDLYWGSLWWCNIIAGYSLSAALSRVHYRKCINKIWDGKSLFPPDPGWFSFLESLWNRKYVLILASSLSELFNPTHCGSLSIETIYFTLSMNNEMPQS